MKSLYLAWQAPESSPRRRAWFPVGRLDADPDDASTPAYRFRYTGGARAAEHEVGFGPLLSFPEFEKDYCSSTLFPIFENRVLSPKREDFPQYIDWMGLDRAGADPISILEVSGGMRATDSLQVFPRVVPDDEGNFSLRFFLHGLRHLGVAAQERAKALVAGDELRIMVEVNNPATRLAVPLLTEDYVMIGWAPRYLVSDLVSCVPSAPELTAKVVKVKVNGDGAPLNQSLLIEYTGRTPEGGELMDGSDFAPLIGSE